MSLPGAAQMDACFISYSRGDEQFALRFANDLRSAEVATWVDQTTSAPASIGTVQSSEPLPAVAALSCFFRPARSLLKMLPTKSVLPSICARQSFR